MRIDARNLRLQVATWLGVDQCDLHVVPDGVIDAIARRISQRDHATVLRDELLEIVHESLVEMRYLARTDPLTQLANRHAVEERLSDEVARARRHGRELAVVLLDVDNLKTVNDGFGHAAGDELLREVGNRIKDVVRVSDLPGRWGGDEFIIVCPETDGEAARSLADKLQHTIADRPVKLTGRIWPATVSVGWAVDGRSGDAASLFAAADASLYAAKRQNRNRRGTLGRVHVLGRPQVPADSATALPDKE